MAEKKVSVGDVKLFPELHSSIEIILNEKLRKKEELEAVLQSYQLQLSKVKTDTQREQSAFKQWKAMELQKFEQEKNTKRNELLKRENLINNGLKEHTYRMEELQKRELAVKALEDEKNALSLARIDVENMMREARRIAQSGQNKLEDAEDATIRANEKESSLKEREITLKDKSDKLNSRVEEYNKKEELLLDEKKNLEEVRKSIKPQLEEYKKLVAKNKSQLAEIDSKTRTLNEKIQEEKHALDLLSTEKAYIRKKMTEINQREDELKRKELLRK